jgi:hypothetical protein
LATLLVELPNVSEWQYECQIHYSEIPFTYFFLVLLIQLMITKSMWIQVNMQSIILCVMPLSVFWTKFNQSCWFSFIPWLGTHFHYQAVSIWKIDICGAELAVAISRSHTAWNLSILLENCSSGDQVEIKIINLRTFKLNPCSSFSA